MKNHNDQQKQAVIISQHSPACHQISGLLEKHGWNTTLADTNTNFHTICKLNPSLFIADIEDPGCRGIDIEYHCHGVVTLLSQQPHNPNLHCSTTEKGGTLCLITIWIFPKS